MNELLQRHGCSNVFNVPEGLKELMSDISREVLRWQPPKICDFIAKYLSALLITREHGIMAMKVLEDLCDCRPSVSEHLLQIGLEKDEAEMLADIIKEEVEDSEPAEGKEKVKEYAILKKILNRVPLDEEMTTKVCQVARNAYRDYWYRKKLMSKSITMHDEEPWEIAAQHTLEIYKKTKPSLSELNNAALRIQAAYKGYHVRRRTLRHLSPAKGRKVELPGPPLDVSGAREIDLGPMIDIKPKVDDVLTIFGEQASQKLGISYDPTKTITHVEDDQFLEQKKSLSKFPSQESRKRNLSQNNRRGVEGQSQSSASDRTPYNVVTTVHAATRISFANEPVRMIPYDESADPSQGLSGDMEIPEAIEAFAVDEEHDASNEVEDYALPASARSMEDAGEVIEEIYN